MSTQHESRRCSHGNAPEHCWIGRCRQQEHERLEAQVVELVKALSDTVCALEVCGKDFRATEKARELIAKHRAQHDIGLQSATENGTRCDQDHDFINCAEWAQKLAGDNNGNQ